MRKAIITTVNVDKTFEGEDCLLMRTIVSSNKKDGIEKFVILTERCNYYDVEVPKVDTEGNPVLDAEGNQVIDLVPTLKMLGKKDTESVFSVTDATADLMYDAIKGGFFGNIVLIIIAVVLFIALSGQTHTFLIYLLH